MKGREYADMATTETAPKQWLGLGSMGWAIYAVVALVNTFVMVSVADSLEEQAMYAVGVLLMAYGVVRFWKFVFGLLANLANS
jgi:hypothetical protein